MLTTMAMMPQDHDWSLSLAWTNPCTKAEIPPESRNIEGNTWSNMSIDWQGSMIPDLLCKTFTKTFIVHCLEKIYFNVNFLWCAQWVVAFHYFSCHFPLLNLLFSFILQLTWYLMVFFLFWQMWHRIALVFLSYSLVSDLVQCANRSLFAFAKSQWETGINCLC